jgi:hypothetical protein
MSLVIDDTQDDTPYGKCNRSRNLSRNSRFQNRMKHLGKSRRVNVTRHWTENRVTDHNRAPGSPFQTLGKWGPSRGPLRTVCPGQRNSGPRSDQTATEQPHRVDSATEVGPKDHDCADRNACRRNVQVILVTTRLERLLSGPS